jgi:Protein of unknown function (DUF2855)
MTATLHFLVDRQDLGRTRWEDAVLPTGEDLAPGQIHIAHKRFAFTANNITYARLGETFGYWRYFPAADPWGSIPVWGIGEVLQSRHDELAEGQSIYGYFPMSTDVVLTPERLKETGFVDASPHRATLPRTYNEYVRIDRDPAYDPAEADAHLILRPLFSLSFFLAYFLVDKAFFDAHCVIVSSASSKTAMGFAFQLRRLSEIQIIGLTGSANVTFVEGSGLYDDVIDYAAVKSLSDLGPSLYVDIAGDECIRTNVHLTLGDALLYSCAVGMTHGLADPRTRTSLPGPAPEFFFTPTHILTRRETWGPDELRRRLTREWRAFLDQVRMSLAFEHGSGRAAIEHIYAEVLHGRRPPDRADILHFDRE